MAPARCVPTPAWLTLVRAGLVLAGGLLVWLWLDGVAYADDADRPVPTVDAAGEAPADVPDAPTQGSDVVDQLADSATPELPDPAAQLAPVDQLAPVGELVPDPRRLLDDPPAAVDGVVPAGDAVPELAVTEHAVAGPVFGAWTPPPPAADPPRQVDRAYAGDVPVPFPPPSGTSAPAFGPHTGGSGVDVVPGDVTYPAGDGGAADPYRYVDRVRGSPPVPSISPD